MGVPYDMEGSLIIYVEHKISPNEFLKSVK